MILIDSTTPGHHDVLEAAVEVLGVLADHHEVDVVVAALDPRQGLDRAQVRVEVELLAQLDVDRAMAAGDRRLGRPLEGDLVAPHRVEDSRRQRRAVLADGAEARRLGLPLEVDARGRRARAPPPPTTSGPMPSPGMRVTV